MIPIRTTALFVCLAAALAAAPNGVEGDWPRWRGPYDNGMARSGAPVEWTESDIQWTAEIPGRGHSSPVIWENKIFVTTAVGSSLAEAAPPEPPPDRRGRRRGPPRASRPAGEQRFLVLAFDMETGERLWERQVANKTPHEGYHERYGSYASSSPVTDGKILIASFGSFGVYALTLEGEVLWSKDFGSFRMRHEFGEGSAPVLHQDVLLLNFDSEGDDFLVALDKSSGEELWRAERDEPSNWSPPLVISYDGRTEVVVGATNKVRSYDIETGELIWQTGGLGLNAIPAPVTDGDRVFVMTGYRDPNLLAIELGGTGELTDERILWTNQRGNSYTASPVLHNGVLYMLGDRGFLSALNASTGEPYYLQQRLPNPYSFKASPVGADGKLYLASEEGDVIVIEMGENYKSLAVNKMPDEFFVATPAISGGKLFLRGRNTLYAIGK